MCAEVAVYVCAYVCMHVENRGKPPAPPSVLSRLDGLANKHRDPSASTSPGLGFKPVLLGLLSHMALNQAQVLRFTMCVTD